MEILLKNKQHMLLLHTIETVNIITYIGLAIENIPINAPIDMANDPTAKYTSDMVNVYMKYLPAESIRKPAM